MKYMALCVAGMRTVGDTSHRCLRAVGAVDILSSRCLQGCPIPLQEHITSPSEKGASKTPTSGNPTPQWRINGNGKAKQN